MKQKSQEYLTVLSKINENWIKHFNDVKYEWYSKNTENISFFEYQYILI